MYIHFPSCLFAITNGCFFLPGEVTFAINFTYKFQGLSEEQLGLVNDLFEWLVDPCLYFIRKNCKTFLVTSEMHLVQSLMRLYLCLMDEIRTSVEQQEQDAEEGGQQHGLSAQQVWLHLAVRG